jgi:hypothetical protein
MEVTNQLHAPTALSPGKELPTTHWAGDWTDPKADPDPLERSILSLPEIVPRFLGFQSRNKIALFSTLMTLKSHRISYLTLNFLHEMQANCSLIRTLHVAATLLSKSSNFSGLSNSKSYVLKF